MVGTHKTKRMMEEVHRGRSGPDLRGRGRQEGNPENQFKNGAKSLVF